MKKTNNWYVITGGPSSGKTTTLAHLEKLGYQTIPEAARLFIDQEMAKGRTLKQIRADEERFQQQVFEQKLAIESSLDLQSQIFLDRGLHDTLAYQRFYGYEIKPNDIDVLSKSKYKKIFLLEMLEFEQDYARVEDLETAKKLESFLMQVYTEYKLPVVRIPNLPVEKRIQIILENLAA